MLLEATILPSSLPARILHARRCVATQSRRQRERGGNHDTRRWRREGGSGEDVNANRLSFVACACALVKRFSQALAGWNETGPDG